MWVVSVSDSELRQSETRLKTGQHSHSAERRVRDPDIDPHECHQRKKSDIDDSQNTYQNLHQCQHHHYSPRNEVSRDASNDSGFVESHYTNIPVYQSDSQGTQMTMDLDLKPLYFEVPQLGSRQELVGRDWLFSKIMSSSGHMLIEGGPGSGKTAIILSLVEGSCFGSSKSPADHDQRRLGQEVADEVVAYHFCQADNADTCRVPEFVHSLAAQLSQCPRLASYRRLLQADLERQSYLRYIKFEILK